MPGLDSYSVSNQSDQLLSSPSSHAQSARSRVKQDHSADSAHSGQGSAGVATSNGHTAGVRKFTSKELSQLNRRHNAHVAYRGKVHYTRMCVGNGCYLNVHVANL